MNDSTKIHSANSPKALKLITMGDPCGIGPEIIVKAFLAGEAKHSIVIGHVGVMRQAARRLEALLPIAPMTDLASLGDVPPNTLPIWEPPGLPEKLDELPLGRIHADAGKAAAQCVRTAVEHILAKRADALVTAPLHKEALSAAGESYPGHTELLQALTKAPAVRMMLANHELRVVLVTVHLALREAIAQITQARVLDTILMAHNCAVAWGFDKPPRIAVAGLNPHAGEGGLFGREEIDIIEPAIRAARAQGLQVTGPLAPDTVFMRARHTPQRAGEFDIVIAMYHDQGLIPVKYLGVAHGVNVTLGLPFIRTSPDHGTAFDIAGQGTADPTSLIAALKMAESLMSGIATS